MSIDIPTNVFNNESFSTPIVEIKEDADGNESFESYKPSPQDDVDSIVRMTPRLKCFSSSSSEDETFGEEALVAPKFKNEYNGTPLELKLSANKLKRDKHVKEPLNEMMLNKNVMERFELLKPFVTEAATFIHGKGDERLKSKRKQLSPIIKSTFTDSETNKENCCAQCNKPVGAKYSHIIHKSNNHRKHSVPMKRNKTFASTKPFNVSSNKSNHKFRRAATQFCTAIVVYSFIPIDCLHPLHFVESCAS